MQRLLAVALLTLVIVGGMFFAIQTPSAEAMAYRDFHLGEGESSSTWLQGFTTTKDSIYYYEDQKIKQGTRGMVFTHFDFGQLREDLKPYNLNTNSSFFSFILGHMEFHQGDLYVSGLIFRDAQHDRRKINGEHVIAETYSMLFKITPQRTHELLHVSLAKTHTGKYSAYGTYDNATGMPNEEASVYENETLFDPLIHFEGVTPPKFTFDADDVILVRHRESEDLDREVADILRVGSTTIRLTTISLSDEREGYTHLLGYVKGDTLTIHDEYGFYTKKIGSKRMPIYTKLSDEETYLRPTYKDGRMYFLNERGFLTLRYNRPHYLIWASDAHHHIEMSYYEWSTERGVLYTNDFLRPRTFWVFRP